MRSLRFLLAFVAAPALFGQCTYTVSPSSAYSDSTARNVTLQVTASAGTCAWTAASNGFATTSSSGTGNGAAVYALSANTSGVARSVTLTVAGQSVALTQDATPTTFSDVFPPDFYFDGANILRQNNITAGCATSPTLQYCPNQNVTRGQMAIFVVRTVLGGGATVDNFQYSTTPYFTDVPATHVYFKWIQKMRDLGVTAGCSATQYCPNDNITRGQMAVFIVRARLGASTSFTYNPTPSFTDVPANYSYFQWIQKLKEIGVTAGCGANTYCPDQFVTRGQMAIFLVRSGFNQLLSATAPFITSASPNSGAPGNTVTVNLTGINTHFGSGTVVVPGGSLTAGAATVTDATHLKVSITIPSGTTLGPVSITAKTPSVSEEATLPNGFIVGLGDPVPTITSFTPTSGPIGTSVTLTGTGLVSSSGTPADVRMPLQGGGVISAPLTASTSTSLTLVIPSTAGTGPFTVSASSGSVTSAASFTITPSSTFILSATPSSANLIAGQTATYTVTASTANGYSGLANLTLTGLPGGLTAKFNPSQITAGQNSLLTITAPANQAANTAPMVITGSTTVDGIPVTNSANISLNVTPITTSFIGRTVVDDSAETSLASVKVTMLGKDGGGSNTGCTGSVFSDGSGNFALTGLSSSCIGPQLVGFDGNTVTSPPGKYAGVNLVFTLVSGQVVVSPVLVHMPRIDNVETFSVKQNSTADQTFKSVSIPNLQVTVYAGTVMTMPDGTQPDPFPLTAIQVAVDRLPDPMPLTNSMVTAFIVAFQPANTTASKAVAVWFPNTLNTPPGTSVPLMTLDPTRGRPVAYGTGTVSSDGLTIIPDVDPSTGSLQHRYGIVHFDWHGPAASPPPGSSPGPGFPKPWGADPVDLSTGLFVITDVDLQLRSMTPIRLVRTLRNATTLAGPFGIGGDHNYNYRLDLLAPQNGAVVNLIMPDQNRYPFARQPDGTLVNSTVASLRGAVMTTDVSGLSTIKWLDGSQMQFKPGTFLTGSVMISMTDKNNNVVTLQRDPQLPSNITQIIDPSGRTVNLTYDSASRITQVTDPIGRNLVYTYDATGHLATVTHPDGAAWAYTYDAKGNLTTVTDPRGVVIVKNTFDANNRVVQQVQADNSVVSFAYTLTNALVPTSPVVQTVMTDQLGRSATYRFNTVGYTVDVTDPLGNHRAFTREAGTNSLLAISGNAQCPVCASPQSGNMSFTYDANGNRLTATNSVGDSEIFAYASGTNLVTSVTNSLSQQTTFSYDSRGNLVLATDPNSGQRKYVYDGLGRVTKMTDQTGNVTKFAYDGTGNLISFTDANGNTAQFSYDGVSRMVAVKDAKGQTTQFNYDAKDRLTKQTNPNGQVVTFTYDKLGKLKTMTDPKGGVVTVTYDVLERMSSVKDQDGLTTTYSYDAVGNPTAITDRRGQTTTYTYDALNRRVSETFSDGSTVQRQFDAAGRVILENDSVAGVFQYQWDAMGNLVKMTNPFGVVSYTRDKVYKVIARQVTGQPAVNYSYNSRGLFTQIAIGTNTVGFTYDARGLITNVTRSNGVNTTNTYDGAGTRIGISHVNGATTLDSETITRDALNNVANVSRLIGQALTTPSATATYDAANHLTAYGTRTMTTDANGNRLTDVSPTGSTTLNWDARNRLAGMTTPDGYTIGFLYDPEGNLIRRRVTGHGTDAIDRFLVDDNTNVIYQERVSGEKLNMLSGFRFDEQFGLVGSAGTVGFAIHDYLGSVVGNTNQAGVLAGQTDYEPFGQTTQTGSAYPFAFTSRPLAATDLYNLRSRYYDASTGSFISEDPAGPQSDFNFFRYANNSPLSERDPLGLGFSFGVQGGGIADGGIVAGGGAQAFTGGGVFVGGG
jgi:RHS repeat-associated protein